MSLQRVCPNQRPDKHGTKVYHSNSFKTYNKPGRGGSTDLQLWQRHLQQVVQELALATRSAAMCCARELVFPNRLAAQRPSSCLIWLKTIVIPSLEVMICVIELVVLIVLAMETIFLLDLGRESRFGLVHFGLDDRFRFDPRRRNRGWSAAFGSLLGPPTGNGGARLMGRLDSK
jgi:hypothetical protein